MENKRKKRKLGINKGTEERIKGRIKEIDKEDLTARFGLPGKTYDRKTKNK